MAWMYLLECADGSFYTGTTRAALNERVGEHNAGKFKQAYTFARRPVRLVFSQEFANITDAIAAERQVKGWGREKKLALIEGRLDLLPGLSRRKTKEGDERSIARRIADEKKYVLRLECQRSEKKVSTTYCSKGPQMIHTMNMLLQF